MALQRLMPHPLFEILFLRENFWTTRKILVSPEFFGEKTSSNLAMQGFAEEVFVKYAHYSASTSIYFLLSIEESF